MADTDDAAKEEPANEAEPLDPEALKQRLKEEEKAKGRSQRDRRQYRWLVIALFVFFGLLACTFFFLSLIALIPNSSQDRTTALALFLGLSVAAVGSLVLLYLRERRDVPWPGLLLSLFLWFLGAALFFFGVAAAFMFDEPADFLPNLGFAIGICLAPGGLMALAGVGLFAYLAWKEA